MPCAARRGVSRCGGHHAVPRLAGIQRFPQLAGLPRLHPSAVVPHAPGAVAGATADEPIPLRHHTHTNVPGGEQLRARGPLSVRAGATCRRVGTLALHVPHSILHLVSGGDARRPRARADAAICGARTRIVPAGRWEATSCPACHHGQAVVSVPPTGVASSRRFMPGE
jgi:hypothetical protein